MSQGSGDELPSDIGSDGGADTVADDAGFPDDVEEIPRYLDGTIQDDILEVFTPPRVVPAAVAAGLRGEISIDITSGHDLTTDSWQQWTQLTLRSRRPRVVISSAPCTAFCPLIHMAKNKMSLSKLRARQDVGLTLFNFSMMIAHIQRATGTGFIHEHPSRASSWSLASVKEMLESGFYESTTFDQCRYGLTSPLGHPLKKRTRLMSCNVTGVKQEFRLKCNCPKALDFGQGLTKHKIILGNEAGHKLSRWAQCYPKGMVDAFVRCIQQTVAQQTSDAV